MKADKTLVEIVGRLPWKELLEQVEPQEARSFSDAFLGKARDAEASEDLESFKGWQALGRIFYSDLRHIHPSPKSRPSLSESDKEFLPWCLSDAELEVATKLLIESEDTEARAICGDLLWLRRRDASSAKVASLAYLDSADQLFDPIQWNASEERFERAIRLAAAVDAKGQTFANCVARIELCLEKLDGKDPRLLTMRLASLLFSFEAGNIRRLAELCEARGEYGGFANEEGRELDSQYFHLAAKLFGSIGDIDSQIKCRISEAEELAAHAESLASNKPVGLMTAPHFMAKAIEILSDVRGQGERAKELHLEMLAWQEESVPLMFTFGEKISLTESDFEALSQIIQPSFHFSVCKFAALLNPIGVDIHRNRAEKEVSSPFFAIMPPSWLRANGKVDARLNEVIPVGGPAPEPALRKVMLYSARSTWLVSGLYVYGALQLIKDAHKDEPMELGWLAHYSKFVPEERTAIFTRGLEAGLNHDMIGAMHFLIPQVENSLRHLLAINGEVTSRLDTDGTQDEFMLTHLLAHPKLEELLGKDILFDLSGLLNERPGANLRNTLAHGMASEQDLNHLECVYLWWLILRLCVGHLEFPNRKIDANLTD